ncbi:MAG: hypothetical protein Q9221_006746 [Calogaya cf. arnoldii]
MIRPDFDQAQISSAPPLRPRFAPFKPAKMHDDYRKKFAPPIGRPPTASHMRRGGYYRSGREGYFGDRRRSQYHHAPPQLQCRRTHAPGQTRFDDHESPGDDTLSDAYASVESDSSEALSANSFTFDDSISDEGEKQTINEPTAETYASRDVVVSVAGKETGKPSPYLFSGATVLSSRFLGDGIPFWNHCTADLDVVKSIDAVRLQEQTLFRWVHVMFRNTTRLEC